MQKEKIIEEIDIIKHAIDRELKRKNWEHALELVWAAAKISNTSNYVYVDYDLENSIHSIAANVMTPGRRYKADNDVVLFYDGFGFNDRGLVQIYLNALCKVKKVIYVTKSDSKDRLPDVLKIIDDNGCEAVFLNNRANHLDRIFELREIIENKTPGYFFFYSTPFDVVGCAVMHSYEGLVRRFLINLTDHAFWIGAAPIDICVDFRDYGASISRDYRMIPQEKIVCLPYYPIVDEETPFEGFPFEVKKHQKVVFSGGSLYKTLGDDNKYYKIVDYLLRNHDDVIFWYAGSGDSTEMDKIISKYPGRAFLTQERNDLHQVLEHCDLYLSTYPVCGGLMFQYAARAGRVPLTLKNSNISDDFLLDQNGLGIEFNTLEELYSELDHLLDDTEYLRNKETLLRDAVISPQAFEESVRNLVEGRYDRLTPVNYRHIDTEDFIKIYMENFTNDSLDRVVASPDNKVIIKYMPLRFTRGCLKKLIDKIKKSQKS